ncbi:MAG: hypothetical protein JXA54_15610 [Candidatus Heimdallarchaeota archaeon]|nr:hypothetical protein [Candidatus Heimdallarchaeota archaeon]
MTMGKEPFRMSPAIGLFFVGGFTVIVAIISSILITKAGFYEIFGFGPFVGPLLFGIIAIAMFIGGVVVHIRFKKHQSGMPSTSPFGAPYQSSYGGVYDSTSLLYDQKNQEFVRERLKVSDHHVDWQKISPMIYKGKLLDEKCPICKLQLKTTDTILQCPNCSSLFHDQHFIEWIISNRTCPICFMEINIQ